MKICWDNLEGIYLVKSGTFIKGHNSFIERESCIECGDFYLTNKYRPSNYCSRNCALKERKFSDRTKQKMSEAWKTRNPVSEETRRKQSKAHKGLQCGPKNGMYGKTHSDKVKKSLSRRSKGNKYRFGISHTEKTKKYLSTINIGELNGNWRGGKSFEPYCVDWTKEYKEFIKERDNHICLNPYCLKLSETLVVHHIDYNKKNCQPNNLITVCNSCNSRANIDREWHKAWYTTIMERRYNG